MEFPETIDILPLPATPARAARQALLIQGKVDQAGSIPAAVRAAVDAIYAVTPEDESSEIKRLRLLYQRAYSRAELEGLVRATLTGLGVRAPRVS